MKKSLDALVVATALGAASLHAEPLRADQANDLWLTLQERPLMLFAILAVVVLLMVVCVVLWRRKARESEPALFENTYDAGFDTIQPSQRKDPYVRTVTRNTDTDAKTDTVVAPLSVPVDFDVPRFLRKSKAAFIRLQAAWDKADLADIRRFTSRELFAEFSRQLKERGSAPSVTEVVTLGAELASVETVDEYYVAKVRFSGMIREDADAAVEPFTEVWKLSKPLDGHRSWAVTSIEQY